MKNTDFQKWLNDNYRQSVYPDYLLPKDCDYPLIDIREATTKFYGTQPKEANPANTVQGEDEVISLAIGISTDDESAQIINQSGWHVAKVEISPTLETAEEIVRRFNLFPDMYHFIKTVYNRLKSTMERAGGSSSFGDTFHVMYDDKKSIGEIMEAILNRIDNKQ